MPFVDSQGGFSPVIPTVQTQTETPYTDLLDISSKTTFSIGEVSDYLSYSAAVENRTDPNYDPFDDISGYEDYADSFISVKNRDHAALLKARIDAQLAGEKALSESGLRGASAVLALGLVDPVNWIPVGGQLKAAYTLGRAGRIAKSAIAVGKAGLLSSVIGEGISQATLETRTAGQSAQAIAAGTLLSGVLGGAAGAFGRRADEAAPLIEKELDAYVADSVGAMRTNDLSMEQETLSSAFGLEKAIKFQDPLLRTTQSESLATRQAVQELAEIPLRFKKNEEGIASPIATETLMKRWHGPLAESITDMDNAFVKYRTGKEKSLLNRPLTIGARDLVSDSGKLNHMQFREEIGKALRRGDQSDIPEVAEAARAYRQKIFDPLKDEAIKAKLLPEDVSVDTALSYFTRIYDVEKIVARRNDFEGRITSWLADSQKAMSQRLANAEEKLADTDRAFANLSKDDMQQIAGEITDTILGSQPGRIPYGPVPLTRGPLKERTLGIPDEMIEDFLDSDVEKVARIYTRTMSADVELAKRFGRADMQDQINKILDDYATKRANVTDEKELARLNKAMKADIRDVQAIRDRLRGTYALPANPAGLTVRTFRAARNLNYLRLLGGATLSSLADAARAVMAHGVTRSFSQGLVPMVKNLKQFKLAANEVKLSGTALDMVLDSRAMSLGEIADQYGRGSMLERALANATNHFGVATLLSPWTAAMKQFSGVISQTRSLQAIEALAKGKIDQKEMTRLAQFGISRDMGLRIGEMFKKHGTKENGLYWANTQGWEDRAAATAYQAALVKEVDRIIVTPGQEKPLWMSTELGKTVGQFKSFAISGTQRVLLAGLQERDAAQLNGLLLATGLGMLSYYVKTDNEKLSDNPGVWVKEGVDRAGVTGWFFEANNTAEKLTNGTIGLSPLLGQEQNTRYASRNKVDALLGPTFGLSKDVLDVTGNAVSGDWSESDTHKLRRMLPYQNLFYTRKLLDAAEESLQ